VIEKLLLALLLVSALYSDVTYNEAYTLYKEDKFKESLAMFEELVAKNSDNDAAYILGYMYEHGEGCEVDMQKSQKYYKIAAHGYYFTNKPNPLRDTTKTHKLIYNTLEKSDDTKTQETIAQYTQSLYNIKAHKANYFLPLSYRYGGEYAAPASSDHQINQLETEFQVSLKYDFTSNIFGLNEIYSIAYTQHSFWQLYVESAYFRENNYNPEFFISLPLSVIPYLKGVRMELAHESNGRGGAEERSWNYVSAEFYFQTGALFSGVKFYKDILDIHYNPKLMDYRGYGEIDFMLPYKEHLFNLNMRHIFSRYRAVQVDYSYPFFDSKDLFFYIKAFSGYGESLIDYNHEVHKIGIGFSISR